MAGFSLTHLQAVAHVPPRLQHLPQRPPQALLRAHVPPDLRLPLQILLHVVPQSIDVEFSSLAPPVFLTSGVLEQLHHHLPRRERVLARLVAGGIEQHRQEHGGVDARGRVVVRARREGGYGRPGGVGVPRLVEVLGRRHATGGGGGGGAMMMMGVVRDGGGGDGGGGGADDAER